MKMIIYVEPVGKGRPRTVRRGDRTITYTPHTTAHAESLIREAVMKLDETFAGKTPLRLEATFYRVRPKSLSKRITMPVSRPDIDNLYKTLGDSLEKFVYPNDSQITTAIIKKRFGSPPRIELVLTEDQQA